MPCLSLLLWILALFWVKVLVYPVPNKNCQSVRVGLRRDITSNINHLKSNSLTVINSVIQVCEFNQDLMCCPSLFTTAILQDRARILPDKSPKISSGFSRG